MSTRILLSPNEQNFLCHVLSSFITGETLPALPEAVQWDRFQKVLALNGLIPIFHHCMKDSGIPKSYLDAWQHRAIGNLVRSRRHTSATVKLFEILDAADIQAVALRGIVLSHWIYSDPLHRPMADVDILVAKESVPRILTQLASHGYSPQKISRNQVVYSIDSCKFEIHWNLIKTRFPMNFEPWIITRRKVLSELGPIFSLDPENELIELIAHAFIHHDVDTLLKVLDIALLCQKEHINWEYVSDWCERASMGKIFVFTLGLVDHLLQTNLRTHLYLRGKQPDLSAHVFAPYVLRMFGHDRRINFLRRRKNYLSLTCGSWMNLRLMWRLTRQRDMKYFLRIDFDDRKALQESRRTIGKMAKAGI